MDNPTLTKEQISKLQNAPLDEVLHQLQTSPDGLTDVEAGKRLQQYGSNEITEKKESPIMVFLSYFWGPIPWMIETAAALSAAVRHWLDFIVISVLLVSNAIVGFWEEFQAGNTIAALKATLALRARVKRDGKWKDIEAKELVPGDIVRLRLGEIIPADARLLEGDPIQVDQSALTGESLPVEKNAGNAVYSGSMVKQGEIEAAVYATGQNTYFGKTAQLVEEAATRSHFQQAVLKIGDYLIVCAVILAVLVFVVSLFRHVDWLMTLEFVLVLVVAAIPVAMPTVLSVTMAVGARRLAEKQAIVTRLTAVEELAGIDVLCSDKTGTLTQNKLALSDPFVVSGVEKEDLILAGALASREEDNDPIDLAVIGGVQDKDRIKQFQVTHFMPFDPVHKRTEAAIKEPDGKEFKVTKGAPQVILQLAADRDEVAESVNSAIEGFASKGFRSLGVARADNDDQWHFLGVLPMSDPPRADSKQIIQDARDLGIHTKMITGDQTAIAKEIARQLGLGTSILDAGVFDQYSDKAVLGEKIEEADGFAQVFPEHKFEIVSLLQKRGHIVGMTGDGVNDAPPLKKADAGIAVSGATDAARAAAAIVLLAPGLSVIIEAIRQSRVIFQRMNNYAIYRIAETIGLLFFITLSILIFNFYPVTAIMIVLLAILNDGAIVSIAYDNAVPSQKPEAWDMRKVLTIASVLGVFRLFVSFSLLWLGSDILGLSRTTIQTFLYLNLSVGGHFTVFAARTRDRFWSVAPSRTLIIAVILTQIIATFISVYGLFLPAINWPLAGLIWGYVGIAFLIQDQLKVWAYKLFEPEFSGLVSARRASRRPQPQ